MVSSGVVMRPCLYAQKVYDMFINGESVSWDFDQSVIESAFADLKTECLGWNVSVPTRAHVFGSVDILPKHSSLAVKVRPLGSYFRNASRKILSLCCRALNYGASKICGASFLSVDSSSKVVKRFDHHNSWIQSEVSAGYVVHTFFGKYDIDGFFNNVEWTLLDRALSWFVSGLQKCHPRGTYLNIPSPSGVRELLDSYSRPFGLSSATLLLHPVPLPSLPPTLLPCLALVD